MARIAPPYHSEDPADWFMFCDMLQDAGSSRYVWQKALRIARSLQEEPGLVLVNVAKTVTGRYRYWDCSWYRPGRGRRFVWCRKEWLSEIGLNDEQGDYTGTFQKPSTDIILLFPHVHKTRCHLQFFHTHSLRRLPSPLNHFKHRF